MVNGGSVQNTDGISAFGSPGSTNARGKRRKRSAAGQRVFEYVLLIVLVAIVCVLSLGLLGHHVQQVFSNVSAGLSQ